MLTFGMDSAIALSLAAFKGHHPVTRSSSLNRHCPYCDRCILQRYVYTAIRWSCHCPSSGHDRG